MPLALRHFMNPGDIKSVLFPVSTGHYQGLGVPESGHRKKPPLENGYRGVLEGGRMISAKQRLASMPR